MPVISHTAFARWYDLYTEADDISKLNATEAFNFILMSGNRREPEVVVSGFLDFPFSGTFTAYTQAMGQEIYVECLHHFFKASLLGMAFNAANNKVYAIVGLKADDHKVVEFDPNLAAFSKK